MCKKKGELTIFLALLLTIVIGFLVVLIESVRVQGIRLYIEEVFDMGLHSCLGEYEQELFKRYDLLFVDTSYRGAEKGNIDNLKKHLAEYIEENMENSGNKGNWYKEELEDLEITGYMYATDENANVFAAQAEEYIEQFGEIKYLPSMQEKSELLSSIKEIDFFMEWDEILAKIDSYGCAITNPGKIVRGMIVPKDKFLNVGTLANIGYKDVVSNRKLNKGKYSGLKVEEKNSSLIYEYIMQKNGYYTNTNSNQVLSGELEYIIYGKYSDEENLDLLIDDLLEKRESDNLDAIKSDALKVAKAKSRAIFILGEKSVDPYLVKLVSDSIIYAWAYAESAIDVSRLLNGGRCVIKKTGNDIELNINELLLFQSRLRESGGKGEDYLDYLGGLIINVPLNVVKYRQLDIIEINLRSYRNDGFRADCLIEYMEGNGYFSSRYGYSHSIMRDLRYEY